jgi:hypothetical protein
MRLVQARLGKTVMAQVKEMASLSFGRGKVTPGEYYDWLLFDDTISAEEKSRFAGLKAQRKIWEVCNFDRGWRGLAWDKIAFYALMKGFGFPVPETVFVLHKRRSFGGIPTGHTEEALSQFLRNEASYPLFCKPNSSLQSLGAAAISGFNNKNGTLVLGDGRLLPPEEFVREVSRYADDGYMVQKRLPPHESLIPICGNNLSTVRMLMILRGGEPRLIHAAWKLPSPDNIADNYWRRGNMLTEIDPDRGRAVRLTIGVGVNQTILDKVPGTDMSVQELPVPDWPAVRDLAFSATSALGHWRLVGWDIGLTKKGPVLVEANNTPDVGLHQIAERRGILTAEFLAFMAECRIEAKRSRDRDKQALRAMRSKVIAQAREHAKMK